MPKAFDIILYGATGFTGRLIAKYIHLRNVDIKWAISGRSQSKLSNLMSELIEMQSPRNLPDILVADATDPKALADICGEARLLLNCTGPFRFLGKEVVEACLKAKCNYMDICGEPQFMEQCFLDYHDSAIESGVLILHSCAFDSVPADLGCLFMMRQFKAQQCSSIESFLSIDCPKGLKGHFTTYEAAVHGLGDLQSLKKVRSEVTKKYKPPTIDHTGPKPARISNYIYENRIKKYAVPFMGSDASVVYASHRAIAMRTGQLSWPYYSANLTINGIYNVATYSFYGSVFSAFSANSWGRSVLLSNPEVFSGGIFSKEGPTQEQLNNTSFQMNFFGKGYSAKEGKDDDSTVMTDSPNNNEKKTEILKKSDVAGTTNLSKPCSFGGIYTGKSKPVDAKKLPGPLPDKEVHVLVSGPEPGYVATPAIFFALAQCLLEEREEMPKGGVLCPSAAFYDSKTVFTRLIKAGLNFQVLSPAEQEGEGEGEEGREEKLGEGVVIEKNADGELIIKNRYDDEDSLIEPNPK